MLTNIKMSVITVVYNGEKYLEQTILSVLNQSYENIEYIIIDGGSTDGTIDIIKKYENRLSYWISEKDKGIYDAMNKGILKATGEIVGIINADDFYESDIFHNIVNCYIENNQPDIIYGNMLLINEDTNQKKIIIPSLNGLIKDMTLNHPTCFIKKSLYDEKLFDTSYRICADYDLIMYFKTKSKKFVYLEKIVANMRIGGASDNFRLSTQEVFKVQQKYYGFRLAIFNNLLRKFKRCIKNFVGFFLSNTSIEKIKGFK